MFEANLTPLQRLRNREAREAIARQMERQHRERVDRAVQAWSEMSQDVQSSDQETART